MNIDFKLITSLPANNTVVESNLQDSMSGALIGPKNRNLKLLNVKPTGEIVIFEGKAWFIYIEI